jgi:hypothetical protein
LEKLHDRISQGQTQWPEEWRAEYVSAVREILLKYVDTRAFGACLDRLDAAFPAYWKGAVCVTSDRADFELSKAQMCWYVENLMDRGIPSSDELASVRDQVCDLLTYAMQSLHGEFPFLSHAHADAALRATQGMLDGMITSAFVPPFQRPLSSRQVAQIKDQWDRACLTRFDLWRQMSYALYSTTSQGVSPDSKRSPYYRFVHRCLLTVVDALWQAGPAPPEYFVKAARRRQEEAAARRRAVKEARVAERRSVPPGDTTLEQIEQWGFVLASLIAGQAWDSPECHESSVSSPNPSQANDAEGGGGAL